MKDRVLVARYLSEGKVMQLATTALGQPWVCSVYFVADSDMNLYWLSLPSRRHSREIAQSNKVAVTVAVKPGQPVIGIQAEGTAAIVTDPAHIEAIMKRYIEKYGIGKDFYKNFIDGRNQHVMYRFTPGAFVLFDEVNFPEEARREINV